MSEGLQPFCETVAYCEVSEKSRLIALSRMARGEIDTAPIWDDVFTLRRGHVAGLGIECIAAGFPCTDISLAGKREGLQSDRSGLFWEVVRLTREIEPAFVILENVWPGVKKFIPTIRSQFESMGFDCRDGFLAASDCGLRHKRQRWFFVAYSNKNAIRISKIEQGCEKKTESLEFMEAREAPDASKEGRKRFQSYPSNIEKTHNDFAGIMERDDWDEAARWLCRDSHGRTNWSYAIGALGDSVPPIQVRKAVGILTGWIKRK